MVYNEPSPLEVKLISQRFTLENSASIETYLATEGYVAIRKALQMTPDAIIEEMKASNLRGRGGAGFPTGMKWSFVPRNTEKPRYIICNSDESEPGTCKDRLLMENDPHQLLEGMMIAGWTVGSTKGYVFIRGEYRYLIDIVDKAIAEAYERGFLGKNVFGSGWDFDIYTHTGAGAYECGEESALLESLEGKRGIPRLKPPFPAVVGAWQSPTLLNNCETFATVPAILRMGGPAYAEIGTPKNGGTRLFCISGHVNKPGVYELPLGFNLLRMIDEVCGGIRNGKKLKAVIPGGSSSPVLKAEECDTPMDFDSMGKLKTMAGLGRCRHSRRGYEHRSTGAENDEVLPTRELRLVHPVPRRNDMAEEDPHTLLRRRRTGGRYQPDWRTGERDVRKNILCSWRCSGHANYRLHREVPRRVRGVSARNQTGGCS